MEDLYKILQLPYNATDYEIYQSFLELINVKQEPNIRNKYITAFITLSDINLRKEYDITLGINNTEDCSQYHYTYFTNGWNFFDINGNLGGDKNLTRTIETLKGDKIRSSVPPHAFFSEGYLTNLLVGDTQRKIQNKNYVPYLASQIETEGLSDDEKHLYFQKIYNKYKTVFLFSQSFASSISSKDYISMPIEEATEYSAQQLLLSKRGVCTNFASLIHEEMKHLGIESYFARMTLHDWVHHVVLYRINNGWYICDLTNEYLFGQAGYTAAKSNYMNIPLNEFLENNIGIERTMILPRYGGDSFLNSDSITLQDFLATKTNTEASGSKNKQ